MKLFATTHVSFSLCSYSNNSITVSHTPTWYATSAVRFARSLQVATIKWQQHKGGKTWQTSIHRSQLGKRKAYEFVAVQDEFLRTHSTRVETPKPVAARFLSFHTGPAMSMCIHWTFSSTNCNKREARRSISTTNRHQCKEFYHE